MTNSVHYKHTEFAVLQDYYIYIVRTLVEDTGLVLTDLLNHIHNYINIHNSALVSSVT
jgi:hypothetical protein